MSNKPVTVVEYIEAKPLQVRLRLNELRSFLRAAYPDAEEMLKWGKPAFVCNGILCIYAGYKSHISLHPTPSVIQSLVEQLHEYKVSENTIQFLVDQPIPKDLILQIASLRGVQKAEYGMGWK